MGCSPERNRNTLNIISLYRPIILPSVKWRCDHPDTNNHAVCERSQVQLKTYELRDIHTHTGASDPSTRQNPHRRRPMYLHRAGDPPTCTEPAIHAPGRIIGKDPRTHTESATHIPNRILIDREPRTRTTNPRHYKRIVKFAKP
jgi:hypothetical protein